MLSLAICDRISAGLAGWLSAHPGGNEAPLRFRYPDICAYERLAGSRTNPRVCLWVINRSVKQLIVITS
jgi:hypothetical protein